MQPGWYPDPLAGGVRWWDGQTWTSYAAPAAAQAFYRPDPHHDLHEEQAAARRASVAVVAAALVGAVNDVAIASWFGHYVRSVIDAVRAGGAVSEPVVSAGFAVSELLAIAAVVAQIILLVWLYQAASFARRAGLPARRDPIWAVIGFFIPVVNLWFPYRSAVDCFPREHGDRRLAAWWWGWYVTATVSSALVMVAAAFSTPAGLVLALGGATAYAFSAVFARRMINAIGGVHQQMVAGFVAR